MDYYNYYKTDVLSEGNRPYYPSPLQSQYQRHSGDQGKKQSKKGRSLDLHYEGSPIKYYDKYQRPLFYKDEHENVNPYLVESPQHYHHRDVTIVKKKRNNKQGVRVLL